VVQQNTMLDLKLRLKLDYICTLGMWSILAYSVNYHLLCNSTVSIWYVHCGTLDCSVFPQTSHSHPMTLLMLYTLISTACKLPSLTWHYASDVHVILQYINITAVWCALCSVSSEMIGPIVSVCSIATYHLHV